MKRILLGVTLTLLIIAGLAALWLFRDLRTPVQHSRGEVYIEIPRGSSPGWIVNKLVAEGVLKHEWPLMLYLKLSGGGSRLRAGEYRFPSPISPLGVFAKLQQGERRLLRLTIPEGWTRWDIASAISKVPELQTDSATVLKLMDDVSEVSDIDPRARNLEGYLYPDTYDFPREATAQEIVQMMVKRFRKVWEIETSTVTSKKDLTPREVVTIASLIETEAKLPEERPLIASVIYNRLAKDIALGIDSSLIYASKLEGKWRNDGKVYKSDVERLSPYNTRIRPGLPPGPIASPGQSSLHAALNPAQTDFLYYVREPARNDGAHNFYADEAGFSAGVRALREWEQKRDAEEARKRAQGNNAP